MRRIETKTVKINDGNRFSKAKNDVENKIPDKNSTHLNVEAMKKRPEVACDMKKWRFNFLETNAGSVRSNVPKQQSSAKTKLAKIIDLSQICQAIVAHIYI